MTRGSGITFGSNAAGSKIHFGGTSWANTRRPGLLDRRSFINENKFRVQNPLLHHRDRQESLRGMAKRTARCQSSSRNHPQANRIEQGNFGDHKYLKDGVSELRIDIGPGYRAYYAVAGQEIVLLLCGGDKRTQIADIDSACTYWKDWQNRGKDLDDEI
jgi:putative addiction module killer protein